MSGEPNLYEKRLVEQAMPKGGVKLGNKLYKSLWAIQEWMRCNCPSCETNMHWFQDPQWFRTKEEAEREMMRLYQEGGSRKGWRGIL